MTHEKLKSHLGLEHPFSRKPISLPQHPKKNKNSLQHLSSSPAKENPPFSPHSLHPQKAHFPALASPYTNHLPKLPPSPTLPSPIPSHSPHSSRPFASGSHTNKPPTTPSFLFFLSYFLLLNSGLPLYDKALPPQNARKSGKSW